MNGRYIKERYPMATKDLKDELLLDGVSQSNSADGKERTHIILGKGLASSEEEIAPRSLKEEVNLHRCHRSRT